MALTYEVAEIMDLGENGEGIGRIGARVVFVPGALPGETVEIEVTESRKNYLKARLVNLLKTSPDRIQPPCAIADRCGGCQIQELSYSGQLRWKQRHVEDCLKRIGRLEGVTVLPVLGMENPWRYRNKVNYPVGGQAAAPLIGFNEIGSHRIVPATGCLIQPEENARILDTVTAYVRAQQVQPYDRRSHTGQLKDILIRSSVKGEWMVVLVTSGRPLPQLEQLVNDLQERHPQVCTLLVNQNPHRDHRLLGKHSQILFGAGALEDIVGDYRFALSAESFFQVNAAQTEVLYERVLEYAGLNGTETVLDLYCGIGTISLMLASRAATVLGVELVEASVRDARRNAETNGVTNAEFIGGAAETVLPTLVERGIRPEVVVVDPPRKGCEASALQAILEMAPQRIVYVSCKPATLARDLRILADGGYTVQEVQPVDMFPHSVHVECVVKLEMK